MSVCKVVVDPRTIEVDQNASAKSRKAGRSWHFLLYVTLSAQRDDIDKPLNGPATVVAGAACGCRQRFVAVSV
jgi:hypothetical protein